MLKSIAKKYNLYNFYNFNLIFINNFNPPPKKNIY